MRHFFVIIICIVALLGACRHFQDNEGLFGRWESEIIATEWGHVIYGLSLFHDDFVLLELKFIDVGETVVWNHEGKYELRDNGQYISFYFPSEEIDLIGGEFKSGDMIIELIGEGSDVVILYKIQGKPLG